MDNKKIETAVKMILEAIGEDPDRDGLKETPKRVASMYAELFKGINEDPAEYLRTSFADRHDEMILLRNIPLHSVCEHHLMPFIGHAHIAYIPDAGGIVGLSKFARVVETLSRRPQVQERLTTQIAEVINKSLKPKGVFVIIEAEHLCMSLRGVQKPGVQTITSAVHGIFRRKEATRAEALALIKG